MPQVEIERKFIIKIPDISAMREFSDYTESKIMQIYLKSPIAVTHRIRSREFCGKTVYTETKKIRIDKMSAVEDEHEISKTDFDRLSLEIQEGTLPINKTRHTFSYRGKVFEIDVYPKWQKTCIMETELNSRDEKVDFPPFIEIVSEVTGNRAYSNASMAKKFPDEKGDL